MGVKVKCEHCRKVFEVPDDAVHKLRICNFCQKKTWARPLGNEEKNATEAPAPNSQNTLIFTIVGLSLVTLVNLILTLRAMKVEEHVRESLLEAPEWQNKIALTLDDVEKKIQEYEQMLARNKAEEFSSEQFASSIVKGWEGSIRWIHSNLTQHQNSLQEIEKRLQKIQNEVQKMKSKEKRGKKEAEVQDAKSPR